MNNNPQESKVLRHRGSEVAGAIQLNEYELPNGNFTSIITIPDEREDWSQEQSDELASLMRSALSKGHIYLQLILDGFHQNYPQTLFCLDQLRESETLEESWFIVDMETKWLSPPQIITFITYNQQQRGTAESNAGAISRYVKAAKGIEPELDEVELQQALAKSLRVNLQDIADWEESYKRSLRTQVRRQNRLLDMSAMKEQKRELSNRMLARMEGASGNIFVLTTQSREAAVLGLIEQLSAKDSSLYS